MFVRLLAGLLLVLAYCHSAIAENLRLVTGDDYAPFTGKSLPAGGMLTQVVQAVLAQGNIESTLDWQPWNRGYLKTLRGEYDATFPYVPTPERELEYLYSAPLLVVEQYIFSRADDPIEQTDVQTLQGRRVCIPLGWQPPTVIQGLIDQQVLVRHSPIGIKECARLVLIGRDDFFVADRRIGDTALQLSGATPDQMRRSNNRVSSSSLHLIVPRNHPRGALIIEMFDQELISFRSNGGYQQALEGYMQARALMAKE
jgi:polar amino acid transport system substrate-binding protein